MSTPERVNSLLAAGGVVGTLIKMAEGMTVAEINEVLKGDYGPVCEPHRALLLLALACREVIVNKAQLIIIGKTPEGNAWLSCPECGWISHNPNDAAMLYCAHCRKFLLQILTPEPNR